MFDSCLIDQHGLTASEHQPLVHHIIVRSDVPFGTQAAQLVHASGESSIPRPVPGTIAVALHARDEAHLKELGDRLSSAEISHCYVWESDDDANYPGQLMAIGVMPTRDREKIRKVLSSLPLVR